MEKPFDLYYLAILPSVEIAEKVYQLKIECNNRFNSKSALRSPAHITLQKPFRWKRDIESLHRCVKDFTSKQAGFMVELNNFGCFEPKVIYVDVVPNELLSNCHFDLNRSLHEKFDIELTKYKDFNPHMTIAFRDLSEENFRKAWVEFKAREFTGSFTAKAVALLKHNGKFWEVEGEIPFKGEVES